MSLPGEISGSINEGAPWLTIIGVSEGGEGALCAEARSAIEEADLIIGWERHLQLIDSAGKETRLWNDKLKKLTEEIENLRGRKVCVLASGNPLFYGVGGYFAKKLGSDEMRVIPGLSILTQICARLLWREPDVEVVTLCGRPLSVLNRALFDGRQLVMLCAAENNAAKVAALLCARGFGNSLMHVFDYVGGPREKKTIYAAHEVSAEAEFSPLHTVAVECHAGADATIYANVPGLPDEAYEHDGQLTKCEIRSLTLARLSPRPGELLWDIGAGAGSVGIEWMRAAPQTRAIAIEARKERVSRIKRNADALGVPELDVRFERAPECLTDLPRPDAIFIGGGLSNAGMIDSCWRALKPGGRLVVNSVTIESEAILVATHREKGGDLTRISINRVSPVGPFQSWRPGMPVTQWSLTKSYMAEGR